MGGKETIAAPCSDCAPFPAPMEELHTLSPGRLNYGDIRWTGQGQSWTWLKNQGSVVCLSEMPLSQAELHEENGCYLASINNGVIRIFSCKSTEQNGFKKEVYQNHRTAGNNSVTHVTLKLRRRKTF